MDIIALCWELTTIIQSLMVFWVFTLPGRKYVVITSLIIFGAMGIGEFLKSRSASDPLLSLAGLVLIIVGTVLLLVYMFPKMKQKPQTLNLSARMKKHARKSGEIE